LLNDERAPTAVYINDSRTKIMGSVLDVWVKMVDQKPDSVGKRPIAYQFYNYAIDCRNDTILTKAAVLYASDGSVLTSANQEQLGTVTQSVVPESTGELVEKAACKES
jgi:hypothetical protein